ncbi:MAG TPA: CHASE2 domain-containing protein, partial [Candidatus Binatia bacterium]|nr:CHASE2 domain-containing protein [Candidatus Binatia bacterium]
MPETNSSRNGFNRAGIIAGLCAGITLVVLVLNFVGPARVNAPLHDANNYLQDFFARTGRFTPANTNLVLIGIDRPSYDDVIFPEDATNNPVLDELRGRFPWSRRVWATLIDRLADAGAKTIVVDLVFAAEADGDAELQAALEKHGVQV